MTNSAQNNEQARTRTHMIRAVFTEKTVRVYQAYNDKIADAAVEAQSFHTALDKGLWSPKRMTWIKPSKVWMAYRCGWTVLKDANQARVLALDLDRFKFEELLARGMLTHGMSSNGKLSNKKCRNHSVVVQWDPERAISLKDRVQVYTNPIQHKRSIQIGLRPPANECLLDPAFVTRITDVTQDFRSALNAIEEGRSMEEVEALLWPNEQTERAMTVPPHVEANLGMTPQRPSSEACTRETKKAVVVLGCTANPPHQGHLHCLRAAEAHAEQSLGFDVLFSTIAVAPFGYVKNKCQRIGSSVGLDDETRLSVLNLTAAHIMEKGPSFHFKPPPRTYGSALECGRALRPTPDITVIVVVGGDRFKWSKPCHADLVTLCCARSDEQQAELKEKFQLDLRAGKVSGDSSKWQLLSTVGPPTSSTVVRSILMAAGLSQDEKRARLQEQGYPDAAMDVLLKAIEGRPSITI